MNLEKVFFFASDGLELMGLLHKGEKPTKRVIISLHGMTSNCLRKREDVIAHHAVNEDIDYFSFNNRGHELQAYASKLVNNEWTKEMVGTAFEDVQDSYFDIIGAIEEMKKHGYEEIYLQGHSLGCTKIVYSYNKMKNEKHPLLNSIKAVILLSLVDIPKAQRVYLGDKYDTVMEIALKNETEGKLNKLMPEGAFIHPISTKTYLRYFRDYEKIDFARYYDQEYTYPELNAIEVPLFMRWGNVHEMIEQEASSLVEMLRGKIENEHKDINFIDGADHGYTDKYDLLADQIVSFLK